MKRISKLSIAALFLSVIGATSFAAGPGPAGPGGPKCHPSCCKPAPIKDCHMLKRQMSKNDIVILTEAKLIKKGNPNVKLGTVTQSPSGFTVTIVTKKSGDLVRTVKLAPNGLPEHVAKRLEHRCAPPHARKAPPQPMENP